MKPGQLGQSDSRIYFLSYYVPLIFYLKQLRTGVQAQRREFYNLGVGKVSLTMTQTPEAIKEKN